MRRVLLVLSAAMLLTAVLLPATASAATWTVKNANGKKIGSVRVFARPKQGVVARVFDNKGHRRGFLTKSSKRYWAFEGSTGGADPSPRAVLLTQWDTTSSEWSLYHPEGIEGEKTYVGRVDKRDGRWYPQTMGDYYHDMGSVAASAPAWVASGSVFCLHPWWWRWP